MELHIDLGQIIIAGLLGLLGIIGFFIKNEVTRFGVRLDNHDRIILRLVGDVQRLIGMTQWNGIDRRSLERRSAGISDES